ncbi:MAG: hypothetical protein QM767_16585 [Anaeromyxobacter sp.]
MVASALAYLAAFPLAMAPSFRRMFDAAGGSLPELTQLALTRWFPPVLTLLPAVLLFAALLPLLTPRWRRALIILGFCAASAALALLHVALYLPILELASIK